MIGQNYGLGGLPTPRAHCVRCGDITRVADSIIQRYRLQVQNQIGIITRLLDGNTDAVGEVSTLAAALGSAQAEVEELRGRIDTLTELLAQQEGADRA